jgi:hypothetical protein
VEGGGTRRVAGSGEWWQLAAGSWSGESRAVVGVGLLEARVERPKSVETRKEIQVGAGRPLLLPTAPPKGQTFSPFGLASVAWPTATATATATLTPWQLAAGQLSCWALDSHSRSTRCSEPPCPRPCARPCSASQHPSIPAASIPASQHQRPHVTRAVPLCHPCPPGLHPCRPSGHTHRASPACSALTVALWRARKQQRSRDETRDETRGERERDERRAAAHGWGMGLLGMLIAVGYVVQCAGRLAAAWPWP